VNNKGKRTADANFSYVLFGDRFSNRHFSVSDYSSFGEDSLIDEVYNHDGYLGVLFDDPEIPYNILKKQWI